MESRLEAGKRKRERELGRVSSKKPLHQDPDTKGNSLSYLMVTKTGQVLGKSFFPNEVWTRKKPSQCARHAQLRWIGRKRVYGNVKLIVCLPKRDQRPPKTLHYSRHVQPLWPTQHLHPSGKQCGATSHGDKPLRHNYRHAARPLWLQYVCNLHIHVNFCQISRLFTLDILVPISHLNFFNSQNLPLLTPPRLTVLQ